MANAIRNFMNTKDISLRDFLAAAAMQGASANPLVMDFFKQYGKPGQVMADWLAPGSYAMADAMIKTRGQSSIEALLLEDLRVAASTLRRYEASHRAKDTADSLAKAEVNRDLAERFEATIAKAKS